MGEITHFEEEIEIRSVHLGLTYRHYPLLMVILNPDAMGFGFLSGARIQYHLVSAGLNPIDEDLLHLGMESELKNRRL